MNERGQGPGGPRRDDRASKGPGGPGGNRSGPGGRGGERGGHGRDGGGRGGKGGPRGKGKDDRGGSAAFRVINELGFLEKALTKVDFAGQKGPLDEILRALRPLRLKTLTDLDMNTRGRLITTLFRVVRQAKPAEAPPADAAPVEAAQTEAAAAEAATETVPAAESADAPTEVDAAPAAEPGAPAEAAAPAVAAKAGPSLLSQWQDVMFSVGSIWQSVGDGDRASAAFTQSGREAPKHVAHEPVVHEGEADAAPGKGRERGARGERGERPAADWKTQAQAFEDRGRTRDAARLHETNASWADAARLYEGGGEPRAALRAAIEGKLSELAQKLMGLIRAEDVPGILQKAGAWELLMEWHAKRGDFDGVAKLYERAKQFDQAALAWERGGKLSQARRAYEKANDPAAALRVRDLEIQKLIERGDKLGAATVQMHSGMRDEAAKTLEGLGGPKAYRFMLKLKLEPEAEALLNRELAKAEAEADIGSKAKWLEAKGDLRAAADLLVGAGRKDRAWPLFEQLGELPRAAQLAEEAGLLDRAEALFRKAKDSTNADRVKALPRPAVVARTPAPETPGQTAQTP